MKKIILSCAAALAALSCAPASAAQSEAARQLGQCLYRNSSASDKDTLVQWAYVTIGGTAAARRVQPIPEAASRQVTQATRQAFSRLLLRACPKEAAAALASDPRSAASDALEEMVGLMIRDRMRGKVDEVLSLQGAAGAASGLMRELGAALKKN